MGIKGCNLPLIYSSPITALADCQLGRYGRIRQLSRERKDGCQSEENKDVPIMTERTHCVSLTGPVPHGRLVLKLDATCSEGYLRGKTTSPVFWRYDKPEAPSDTGKASRRETPFPAQLCHHGALGTAKAPSHFLSSAVLIFPMKYSLPAAEVIRHDHQSSGNEFTSLL